MPRAGSTLIQNLIGQNEEFYIIFFICYLLSSIFFVTDASNILRT